MWRLEVTIAKQAGLGHGWSRQQHGLGRQWVRECVFAVCWARVCFRAQCGWGGDREGSEVVAAVWGSCCSYMGLVGFA